MPDKSLSFHWQTDPASIAFLGQAVSDETVRSIVTEAYLVCRADPEQWISYSRRKAFYKRTRYRRTTFTYTTVVRAVDFLAGEGWLEHRKVAPGNLGWQSSFGATPKLMAAIDPSTPIVFETVEPIVLRDRADKERIEYRDTRDSARMRRRLGEINEALASIEIAHPELGMIRCGSPTRIGDANPGPAQQSLCRVFSGNFDQGGRFYGGFWIGMRARERVRLTINGQDVVELDYRGVHPTLLYAEAGVALDGDPYDVPGYPAELRKLIKIAFNTMVNATDRKGAFWAVLQRALALTETGTNPDGWCSPQAVNALLGAIEERHQPIAKAFYSDAGIRLQRIDSGMAENVLLELVRKGIPTLPVHDSFIVEKQHSNHLKEAMNRALENTTGNANSKCSSSLDNQREISPVVSHIAMGSTEGEKPCPGPSLAIAWMTAVSLPPPYGLALVLGVSGVFDNFGSQSVKIGGSRLEAAA